MSGIIPILIVILLCAMVIQLFFSKIISMRANPLLLLSINLFVLSIINITIRPGFRQLSLDLNANLMEIYIAFFFQTLTVFAVFYLTGMLYKKYHTSKDTLSLVFFLAALVSSVILIFNCISFVFYIIGMMNKATSSILGAASAARDSARIFSKTFPAVYVPGFITATATIVAHFLNDQPNLNFGNLDSINLSSVGSGNLKNNKAKEYAVCFYDDQEQLKELLTTGVIDFKLYSKILVEINALKAAKDLEKTIQKPAPEVTPTPVDTIKEVNIDQPKPTETTDNIDNSEQLEASLNAEQIKEYAEIYKDNISLLQTAIDNKVINITDQKLILELIYSNN